MWYNAPDTVSLPLDCRKSINPKPWKTEHFCSGKSSAFLNWFDIRVEDGNRRQSLDKGGLGHYNPLAKIKLSLKDKQITLTQAEKNQSSRRRYKPDYSGDILSFQTFWREGPLVLKMMQFQGE